MQQTSDLTCLRLCCGRSVCQCRSHARSLITLMSNSTAMDLALTTARDFTDRALTVCTEGWAWLSQASPVSASRAAAAAAGPIGHAVEWVSSHQRGLLVAAFLSLCALIYYLSAHVRRPHLMYAHTDFNLWMMRQLPRLHRAYWPTFYLTHEVPQAAVGSFVRFNPRVRKDPGFQREILKMEDGEHIALDWLHPIKNKKGKKGGAAVAPVVPECEDTTPIAFTCHGLAGHTDELNMQYLGLAIRKISGARFAIMNRRGCAHDMVLQNETIYLWGCTADLKETLAHIKRRFPKAPLLGIGLSAGSNLLTKYLGETGLDSLFDAGFSVANSFDVGSTSKSLHAKPFYASIMVNILLDLLNRNLATFKKIQQRQEIDAKQHETKQEDAAAARSRLPSLNLARVRQIKSVLEWDEHFTLLTHAHRGFKNLEELYAAQSTTPELIANISVPLLNLHALDDPILPAKRGLDYTRALESNSHVILATTIRGGHLGFTEGLWPFNKATWLETLVAEWVRAISTPEALEKLRALRRRDREAKEEIRLAERERRIAAEKERLKTAVASEQEHEESKSNGRSPQTLRPRSPVLHPNPHQPPLQSTHNHHANLNHRHNNGNNHQHNGHSHSHQLELPTRQGSAHPQQQKMNHQQQPSRRSKSPSPAAAASAHGHSHRSNGHTAAAAAGSLDFSFGTDDLGIGPIATYLPSPTDSPPAVSAADASPASQDSSYSLADYASLTGESSQPPVMHRARSDDSVEADDDVSELPDASPIVPATPFAHPHGYVAAAAAYPDASPSPSPSPTPSSPPAVSSPVMSQSVVSVMFVPQGRTVSPMLPTQETMDYEREPEDEAEEEAPSPKATAASRGRAQPAWKSGAAAAAGPQQAQSRSQKRPVSAAHAAPAHAPVAAVPASPAKRRRSDAAASADAAPSSPSARPSRTTSRTSSTPNKKPN